VFILFCIADTKLSSLGKEGVAICYIPYINVIYHLIEYNIIGFIGVYRV
jgi:hypothetical protein